MRGKRTAIALVLVVALGGCGSSGDDNPALTSGQEQGLVAQLQEARAAAAARNVAGTEAAIGRFRRSVVDLRRAGALSDASARALRIGAARVLARVKSDNAPPAQPAPSTTSSQTTPAPAPAPGPRGKEKKDHKEHKPGKEHGHGDGEGGD